MSSTLINISSVVPSTTEPGKQNIVARWKNGKNDDGTVKLVSDANRVRAITLPADIWTTGSDSISADNDQLRLFMLDAISDLAKARLSKLCEDSNMQRTQVPQEEFSLSNLLAWNAEQAAISGRLNGDEIREWLKQSATIKDVTEKHGKDIATALGNQFVKLASPNHGLQPAKAEKLLSSLFNPSDADSTTGLRVMLKLQAIRDKKESNENLLDSIL